MIWTRTGLHKSGVRKLKPQGRLINLVCGFVASSHIQKVNLAITLSKIRLHTYICICIQERNEKKKMTEQERLYPQSCKGNLYIYMINSSTLYGRIYKSSQWKKPWLSYDGNMNKAPTCARNLVSIFHAVFTFWKPYKGGFITAINVWLKAGIVSSLIEPGDWNGIFKRQKSPPSDLHLGSNYLNNFQPLRHSPP